MKKSVFNEELLGYIKEGQKEKQRFEDLSKDIQNISPKDSFPHFYIWSQAGLGKSHTVKETFKKAGIKNFSLINGGLTMNGFINEIAVIARSLKKNEHHYVYLEDCTGLLNKEEDINIMKNVLRDEKCISYHKNPSKILNDALDTLYIAKYKLIHLKDNERELIDKKNKLKKSENSTADIQKQI